MDPIQSALPYVKRRPPEKGERKIGE